MMNVCIRELTPRCSSVTRFFLTSTLVLSLTQALKLLSVSSRFKDLLALNDLSRCQHNLPQTRVVLKLRLSHQTRKLFRICGLTIQSEEISYALEVTGASFSGATRSKMQQ